VTTQGLDQSSSYSHADSYPLGRVKEPQTFTTRHVLFQFRATVFQAQIQDLSSDHATDTSLQVTFWKLFDIKP